MAADEEPPYERAPYGADQSERPPAPPGGGRRRFRFGRRFLLIGSGVLAFLLIAAGGLLWYGYQKLDGNIGRDTRTGELLRQQESERPSRSAAAGSAQNILLIGSDDRSGANAAYGAAGGQRSDTTILLHLAADRRHATAVSIPRDLMVTVPPCRLPDGTRSGTRFIQFNWAFELGGAACAIRAVEKMSGIRVDHHLILDFTGFKKMVEAVDGVEVCVPHAIHDKDAQLDLPAGRQTLNGEQALGYVRARETLGDGSDTQRMGRQQLFLASLIRKVQSQGVLLDPTKLWPLLSAATSAITADEGLSHLSALYDLAQDLRSTDPESIVFLTAPRRPYPSDWNRDELVQPQADQLFAALRADRVVEVRPYQSASPTPTPAPAPSPVDDPSGDPSSGPTPDGGSPSASVTALPETSPTLEGQRATQEVCPMH
ncbi:LCP family protein [Kitasatospora sp. MMS16-BH015]|uniref:LCP family protein n=1 Tax=Kitasatospora sp. MMS16-BH015 TaxID=2018025 RepID=UPI0020C325A7|nr:LCP family protein [Kitasatospora sp. MMS16-BH015]